MGREWKTAFKGVRYYEHPTRKHGVSMDRYYAIRYQKKGYGRCEEGLGWASEGWTVEKAIVELKKLKDAAQVGEGPVRLAEKRDIAIKKRADQEAEKAKQAQEAITFDDFFTNEYLPLARGNKKTSTVDREEGLYRLWIKNVIGHMTFHSIMPLHLEAIKQRMAKAEKSPRTIEYALVIIRQVFHYAKDRKIIKALPFAFTKRNIKRADAMDQGKVVMPKPDNARMRYFKPDEMNKLLDLLKKRSRDTYDMTLLAFHAGLRFSEITALTWADVNLNEGFLTIRDAKTGSRFAYLTPEAIETLNKRKHGKPPDFVFQKRGTDGERVSSLSHLFYRAIDELGFNKGITDRRLRLCFHSARHTYGTVMYEQTGDLYIVQKSMGHATGIMTQRYAKMADHRLREATKALGVAYKKTAEASVVELKQK